MFNKNASKTVFNKTTSRGSLTIVFNKTHSNRRHKRKLASERVWEHKETLLLLEKWGDENIQLQLKSCTREKPIWMQNCAQVTGRFERRIFASFSYSRKYRIDLCSQIKPIAYCWLYGFLIRFSPNNLKREARCGSDLLGYKLTKLCKSCGRGKFANT